MICPTCGFVNLPGLDTCSNCQEDLARLDDPHPASPVERSLMHDRVRALKEQSPVVLAPEATVGDAIRRMLDFNTGAALIVGPDGKLLGIFTERDLLKKVAGIHADYAGLPVSWFMTARPENVAPADTLNYVLHKMDAGGYRHVPVVEAGRPVNLISVRDMLRYLTRLCKECTH